MKRFVFSAILCLFAGCSRQPQPPAAIVLVISDGTSQELVTAARTYAHGAGGKLELESLPRTAIVRTHSLEDAVTDSSAAATAMARGVKAENRAVGMVAPGSPANLPSVLDLARRAGWSTGVVSDDSVTGATPASFLVEHRSRLEEAQIADKIVTALGPRADIVLGGGSKWFADLSAAAKYAPGQIDIVKATQARLAKGGVNRFTEWQAFSDAMNAGGASGPVLGTFAAAEFPFYADGPRTPRVADMAVAAVRFLQSKGRPFFLMVEAGLPDKAAHFGQAKRAVVEVLELDHLISELRKNLPPRSLLLVTTDHNTGGLALNGPPVPIGLRGDALMGANPASGKSILSWATGPGADLAQSNQRMREVEIPGGGMRAMSEPKKPGDPDYQQPAALAGKAASHTGGDVWLLGDGPGSEKVHGFLDNTDIFKIIASEIPEPAK